KYLAVREIDVVLKDPVGKTGSAVEHGPAPEAVGDLQVGGASAKVHGHESGLAVLDLDVVDVGAGIDVEVVVGFHIVDHDGVAAVAGDDVEVMNDVHDCQIHEVVSAIERAGVDREV